MIGTLSGTTVAPLPVPTTEPDTDGDQIGDAVDNFTLAANPGQEDTDFDGTAMPAIPICTGTA